MPAEPCEDCGKMMSANAAVCPHCRHRQSDRDMVDPELAGPKKKPKKLSITSEEAGAIFEVQGIASGTMEYERPRGPLALVLPRAESAGWVRGLEWLLTLLALPLLLGGMALLVFSPRLWRAVGRANEIALTIGVALFGGLGIFSIGALSGLEDPALWGILAFSGGALIARVIVRTMRPR